MSGYWEKYKEKHRTSQMIDKHSPLSAQEYQVSPSPQLLVHSLSETLELLQSQVNTSEEKIMNLTRLVKLQQSFSESQEEELSSLKSQIRSLCPNSQAEFPLEAKLRSLEKEIASLSKFKPLDFRTELDHSLHQAESRINSLVRAASEELEVKQLHLQAKIEKAIDQAGKELTSDYKSLNQKIVKIQEFGNSASFGRPEQFEELFEQSQSQANESVKMLNARVKSLEKFQIEISESIAGKSREIKQATELAWNAEEVCARVSEDCLTRLKHSEVQIKDLQQFLMSTAEEIKSIELSLGVKPLDLDEVEENVANRVAGTLEKIVLQVKQYVNSQKRLEGELELLKQEGALTHRKSIVSAKPRERTVRNKSATPRNRSYSNLRTSLSPRATTKSRAMEASIKQKLLQLKARENDRRATQKKSNLYKDLS